MSMLVPSLRLIEKNLEIAWQDHGSLGLLEPYKIMM